MIRIEGKGDRVCDGLTRRQLLAFGGLGALGLAHGAAAAPSARARAVLFISLFGGPSHQDIWDLKPGAPAEVRGEFNPIGTSVPGIQVCEHIPRLAKLAHRYALVRSVTHQDNGHGSAMYAGFTGWPHPLPNTNPIPDSSDYPSYGSVVAQLRRSPPSVPPFIVVGGTQFVCGNQIPGQRAGFLGPGAEPFVIAGDPNREGFRVPELSLLPEVPTLRLTRRRGLLRSVEQAARMAERSQGAAAAGTLEREAFELLASDTIRRALDLSAEEARVRDRFSRTTFGQSLLLGRRLIEAGVPFVTVNWSTGGPWDTHGGNFPALKNSLLPALDLTLSALLEDLEARGLLETTLVVATGEFGRTPRVNRDAGRDHWAGVYTTFLAGGGVRGGRVHGASDSEAAYPADDAVGPWDIGATLYHCMGISPATEVQDRTLRPLPISRGTAIQSLL